jgi:integrase/recombinase XerD
VFAGQESDFVATLLELALVVAACADRKSDDAADPNVEPEPSVATPGQSVVAIPLAARAARAVDLYVGDRGAGPILVSATVQPMNRHAADPDGEAAGPPGRDRQASLAAQVRHAFITPALDAGVPLRDVQLAASHADSRTTMRYDRRRRSLDRHAT